MKIEIQADQPQFDDQSGGQPTPLIEIGWLVAGSLEETDVEAIRQARQEVLDELQDELPQFQWRMPLITQPGMVRGRKVEPVTLLDLAAAERNVRRWDFSLVITAADLVSHYKPDAVATLSRTLEGAVLSTARIDPRAWRSRADEVQRRNAMTRRLKAIVFHVLGHWTGLLHHDDDANYMFKSQTIEQLDDARSFSAEQLREMRQELCDIADQRLEEQEGSEDIRPLLFYWRAAWLNRDDLRRAIVEARPWQFPYRLSRLTTAAISAMLIMLITAEVWDLGMQQSMPLTAFLSLSVICLATAFIIRRQGLLIRHDTRRLSEQVVLTNVATSLIVSLGMSATYALLYLGTVLVSLLLFPDRLAAGWAASVDQPLTWSNYAVLAGFIAYLGIFIGALGASFEQQHYFRHVTFVDEEI